MGTVTDLNPKRKRGVPGLVEYALIIAVVSLGAIVALGFLSGKINTLFSSTPRSAPLDQPQNAPSLSPRNPRADAEWRGFVVLSFNSSTQQIKVQGGLCTITLNYSWQGKKLKLAYEPTRNLSILIQTPDDLRRVNKAC